MTPKIRDCAMLAITSFIIHYFGWQFATLGGRGFDQFGTGTVRNSPDSSHEFRAQPTALSRLIGQSSDCGEMKVDRRG